VTRAHVRRLLGRLELAVLAGDLLQAIELFSKLADAAEAVRDAEKGNAPAPARAEGANTDEIGDPRDAATD